MHSRMISSSTTVRSSRQHNALILRSQCVESLYVIAPATRQPQQQQKSLQQQQHRAAVAAAGPRQQHRQQLSVVRHASFFQDQFEDVAGEQPAAVQAAQQQIDTAAADWVFEHHSGVQVCVFGVEHLERQPHIGEWVLQNRPAAVVVETACTPEHGAEAGRGVTCRDQVQGAAGMFLRIFCQIAAALQEQGEAAKAPGGVWTQSTDNFNGEQLAYIAALASGSQLLFGDRPKNITYSRLFGCTTAEQLDQAYAAEVAASYSGMLAQVQQPDAAVQQQMMQQWQHYQQQLSKTAVWNVMMREREAVMLGVVDQVCSKGLLLMPGMPKPSVALVVGSAHFPGLQQLWATGSWKQMVGEDGLSSSSSPVLQAPKIDHVAMEAPGAGLKRGLLEALLQLSMPQEVLDDVQDCYPPISEAEAEPREWTFEIYSTCRMQLATLPADLLQQVCGALPGCQMDELLQPLRELRPSNGGKGWDPEIGMQLRGLNFDLTVDAAEE